MTNGNVIFGFFPNNSGVVFDFGCVVRVVFFILLLFFYILEPDVEIFSTVSLLSSNIKRLIRIS